MDFSGASIVKALREMAGDQLPQVERALEDCVASCPETLRGPVSRIVLSGGKRLRPLLLLACGEKPGAASVKLAAAIEMMHCATLLHDDVVDESLERRGRPSANAVHGNKICILAGDWLLAKALVLVNETGIAECQLAMAEALCSLANGEALQMGFADFASMDEGKLLAVAEAKTAALFAAACYCGAIAGGSTEDEASVLRDSGRDFGIAFQLRDDCAEYEGETPGSDFTEGVPSMPVFLAWRDGDKSVRRIIEDWSENPGSVEYSTFRRMLQDVGVLEKAQKLAAAYEEKAIKPGSGGRMLQAMSSSMTVSVSSGNG